MRMKKERRSKVTREGESPRVGRMGGLVRLAQANQKALLEARTWPITALYWDGGDSD